MRILMLAQFYPPILGGEERHVRNLAQALVTRGHDVAVVTLSDDAKNSEDFDGPVRVSRISGLMQRAAWLFSDSGRRHATPFPDPEMTMRLHTIVKSFKPDVIHAHNWIIRSFLPVAKLTAAPLVLTLHDYSMVCAKKTLMRGDTVCAGPSVSRCVPCAGEHYGRLKGFVTAATNSVAGALQARIVDRIVTVSSAVAEGNSLVDRVPYQVIPNFIPDHFPSEDGHEQRLAELPREPYMLFVGDLRRLKGVHAAIDAYQKLRSAPPLVLIGRECPDTPKTLPPGVTILHSWPHGAIMHAWRKSLFGLVPSIWPDPCPTTALEAMACSKAVVGARSGGIPDMVDHGVNGMIVPPNDPVALAEAMQALIDDPERTRHMGTLAAVKAKHFMASSVVPKLEQVYFDAIAEKSKVGSKSPARSLAGKS